MMRVVRMGRRSSVMTRSVTQATMMELTVRVDAAGMVNAMRQSATRMI